MKKNSLAKLLSFLLALALCMGMLPTDALAAEGFTDVSGHWAKEHIAWAVEHDLFRGVSADRFDPNGTVTRSMAVTVLHRLAGCPAASAPGGYLDVKQGAWYSDAVAWANENKIVTGYGNGKFGTNDPVTREQLVTFLFRYAGYAGYSTAERDSLSRYSDIGAVSAYAKNAFRWAVKAGVITGKSGARLDPKGKATRAEVAVVLRRMAALPEGGDGNSALSSLVEEVGQLVYQMTPAPTVSAVGGEWAVLGLARSEYSVPETYFQGYYSAVESYVKEHGGVLHEKKYTEYSRVILALSSIGKDPRNVAGYDLTVPLGDYEKTIQQGLNGPVWALIALDSKEYPMPVNREAKTQATRQMYVDHILACQLDGGGWDLADKGGAGKADPDTTGMALQALARYQDQPAVKKAVEAALTCMSKQQDSKGGFSSWGTANSESCAQMIVALCQLGIPLDDPRFVKNGHTLTDCLMSFYLPGQGFAHGTGETTKNQMATEQAFYALVAAWRAETGRTGLYSMK